MPWRVDACELFTNDVYHIDVSIKGRCFKLLLEDSDITSISEWQLINLRCKRERVFQHF